LQVGVQRNHDLAVALAKPARIAAAGEVRASSTTRTAPCALAANLAQMASDWSAEPSSTNRTSHGRRTRHHQARAVPQHVQIAASL